MPEPRYFIVSGRVQGVGFRAATRDKARSLGIAGWVRNRSDGDVELVAGGPDDAIDTLRSWLGSGPAPASVDSLNEEDAAPGDLPVPFEIR